MEEDWDMDDQEGVAYPIVRDESLFQSVLNNKVGKGDVTLAQNINNMSIEISNGRLWVMLLFLDLYKKMNLICIYYQSYFLIHLFSATEKIK